MTPCYQLYAHFSQTHILSTDLPCCDYSQSPICQTTCKSVLEIGESTQEVIDALEKGGCGPPLPHEPLWQCFLSAERKIIHPSSSGIESVSKINQLGMDSAKLHCCHKAMAPKCRRLCAQTFSNDWTDARGDFETDCYSKVNEIALRTCIDEGIFYFLLYTIIYQ